MAKKMVTLTDKGYLKMKRREIVNEREKKWMTKKKMKKSRINYGENLKKCLYGAVKF